jgi:hypothetical protein
MLNTDSNKKYLQNMATLFPNLRTRFKVSLQEKSPGFIVTDSAEEAWQLLL